MLLKKILQSVDVESLTALATWFIVAATGLYLMWDSGDYSVAVMWLTVGLFVLYIVCWLATVADNVQYAKDAEVRTVLLCSQYIVVLALYFIVPFSYVAILITIWACQLPYFMSVRMALLTSPLWSLRSASPPGG